MLLLPFCQYCDKILDFIKFDFMYIYSLSFYFQQLDPYFTIFYQQLGRKIFTDSKKCELTLQNFIFDLATQAKFLKIKVF